MTWKKGQSGNPGGRPKGVERMFREAIAATQCKDVTEEDGPDGKPVKVERWVDAWEMARIRLVRIMQFGEDKDAIAAIKLMHERAFGMPKQDVSITEGASESPEIDWSRVPIARRRELFAAMAEIEALTASAGAGDPAAEN